MRFRPQKTPPIYNQQVLSTAILSMYVPTAVSEIQIEKRLISIDQIKYTD